MIPPRRAAVLLACFLVAGAAAGQSPFADDERAARIAERYESMLAANPAEGVALDRLWKMYEERNATGALLDQYRRAAEKADKAADALVYGHLLRRAGRLDEAAGSYGRAARLDPANPLPLVAQADLALDRQRPAESAALLEQALGKTPPADRRQAGWLSKLGDAWLAAGQPLKAAEAWEKLVAANPTDLDLHRQLAANYEKNGLPERAIAHDEYLDQHADPAGRASALRELARLHEARGEFDAARDALERGLALTARDNWLYGDLQTRLIRLYQRAGRADELAARWKAAVEQTPRDLGNYDRLVALAEAQGDPDAARAWLERAVELAPRDRGNSLKLARLLTDPGDGRRAAALYDNLLKTQPGNLEWIFARAELDLQAGQTADAVTRIEARVAQNPADESVSVPALRFFLSHRLDAAAETLLASAVARHPTAPEAVLALAKFYFGQRRSPEARAVLDRFAAQPGDPAARAQRWITAADGYKDADQPDEALRCWQEAATLQPGSKAALVAIGELSLAKGDLTGGIGSIERALAVLPAGAERDEVDHKLFQALLDRTPPGDAAPDAVGRPRGGVLFDPRGKPMVIGSAATLPGAGAAVDPPAKEPDRPLLRYLETLEKAACENPSPAAYLRLARWLQWAHRPHEASVAAGAALALEPGSLPALELLADTAAALHDHGAAIRRLGEIAALDPPRKGAVTKRIADLMLEDGEYDGALVLLDRRVQEAPGSVEALTDLALAQQRADRWFDALATWERAYALPRLTPAQRADLRQPTVACHEHLGQFQRAAELLQAAVDAQDDLSARQDLFRELAAFCQTHALTPWLETLYRARLAAQPQDYFAMTALATLQDAAGDARSAYALLSRAYYSAPDPAAALRTLVSEAENLGENEQAVAHQRRLVGLPGQANAENLEKLAALEEANLDDEAAARTWEQVAARFSRDTAALAAASEYFSREHRPARAKELLTAVVALDPGDFRRRFQLAQLDLDGGDAAGHRACLEAILARTRPEAAGDPLVLPPELDPAADPAESMAAAGRSSPRMRAAMPDPASGPTAMGGDERTVRLQAIGQLSRALFAKNSAASDEDRRRWLERWRAAAAAGMRSEPLAAFFRAGQADPVSDLTASWIGSPDPLDAGRAAKIFVLAGLRMGNYPPLARWYWDDKQAERGERGALLVETLQFFLSTGGVPTPGMLGQLFPAGVDSRPLLWQAASGVFAEKRWYPQAVELGERALELPGGSLASDAFQLAQWELDAGRVDAARTVLLRAVDEVEGASYDAEANNAVFADLRAYYLLLPPSDRAGFKAAYLSRLQARRGNAIHAGLAAALLHGLAGDEAAPCRELDRIVDLHPLDDRQGGESADVRRWNYVLACGTQLQAWHLDRLAAHVWRHGLAGASAFDKRDEAVRNVLGEIRLRQLVAETTTATDPQEARERVTEYLHEGPSVTALASAASVLMNVGQYAAAIQIYEHLHREMPSESEYARPLLLADDAAGDAAALDGELAAMPDGAIPDGALMNRFEVVARRASLAESVGDPDRACRLLLDARRSYPGALSVLRPLAQTLERRGRLDDAVAIWREAAEHDRGAASLDALASAEIRRGHREAAFAVARGGKEPSSEAEKTWWFGRRVSLYVATGHAKEAFELARQRVRDGKLDGLTEASASLAAQDRGMTRELLSEAIRSTRDPVARFQTQRALIKNSDAAPAVPMADFRREMRRLEQFADGAPGQQEQFLDDRSAFAMARGATDELEGELKREWRDGEGDIGAGDRLADLYIETKQWDALHGLVTVVDARPNLPEPTLFSLETRLMKTGHAAWARPLADQLCQRFPQHGEYAQAHARILWQAGRREEAIEVLDVFDAGCAFRDDFTGQAALVYREFGERARAIASLERMTALDPLAVRSAPVYCRLAALYLEDKRFGDAYRVLTAVYRNPAQADMGPLVDYLAATGRLDAGPFDELPGGEMPLTFLRRAQLFFALCDRLNRTGHKTEAFQLAAAHPELLSSAPALVESLRQNATPEQVPALTKLVEDSVSQAEGPTTLLQSGLAKLYVRRAELAAGQPAQPGVALNFLTQAYELAPEDFAVARPLAAAFRAQGQDARARSVLGPFLAADALPTEQAAARLVLDSK